MKQNQNKNHVRLALLLCLLLAVSLFAACGGNTADTDADTTGETDTGTASDTGTDTPSVDPDTVWIDIASNLYDKNTDPTSSVTVKDKAINTVEPLIFGDNMSWRFDGFGLWNREKGEPYPELMDALKKSGVTALRWPGGIEGDYCHWYEMIGENRVPQLDPFTSQSKNNKEPMTDYPYFGLEEFIGVCDTLGIPAVVQLNCGNGTPEEAADLVKYCVDHNYNVSSFCVGNEMHMGEEMINGITVTKKPADYVDFYLKTYELLGDYADKVEIGCVGLTSSHCIAYFQNWDKEVFPGIADKIDFVDAHIGYTPYSSEKSPKATKEEQTKCYLASASYIDRVITKQLYDIKKYCPANYNDITLQITEYGTLGGDYTNSMAGAAFTAALLGVMTEEPKISSANHFSALLIYEGSPTLVGYKWDGSKIKIFDNAMSFVYRWYSAQSNRTVLSTGVECETFDTSKVGLIPAIVAAPTVYCNTYLDEASKTGSVLLVNCNYKKNEKTKITLPFGVEVTDVGEVYSVDPLSRNSSNVSAITEKHYTPTQTTSTKGEILIESKPVSVVKIDFKVISE